MKKIFSKSSLLLMAVVSLGLTACTDEYEYEGPGQPDAADLNAVYFADGGSMSDVIEVDPKEEKAINVTLKRASTAGELTLPLEVMVNDSNIFQTEPVVFADGAAEATLKVSFPDAKESMVYKYKVRVPSRYVPQYTNFNGKAEFNAAITLVKWDKASDTGYFFDPFMISVFSKLEQKTMAVEYEINEGTDNIRYRFNSPYAYTVTGQDDKGYGYIGYFYNEAADVDGQEHKVIIQVSKADGKATIQPFVLGNNWGYGWFEGGSAEGKFGQFANDVITFPAGSLYFFLPEYNGGSKFPSKAGAFYLNAAALEATAGKK